jgi:hypothetical protein
MRIKKNELAGHEGLTGERRGAYKVLLGRCERKRPLARPRHRWKYDIKIDLQDMGCGHGMDLSGSEQGQVVGSWECGK